MAERIFAAVLLVIFACFLSFASIDIVELIAAGHFGEIFLLLFCVIASVGWIGFLAGLALAGGIPAFPTHQWHPLEE